MELSNKGFSIGEVVKFGWREARRHLFFLIGFLLAALILEALPHFVLYFKDDSPVLTGLMGVVGYVIFLLVSMSFIKIGLKLSNKEIPYFTDLFNTFHLILKFFAVSVLYALILLGGFLLLIFPMVIWGLRYSLVGYFIVDRQVGPIEALRLSARATQGAKWDLLGLYLVSMIISLLGFVTVLGSFITLPTMWIANALAYRYLVRQTEQGIPQ